MPSSPTMAVSVCWGPGIAAQETEFCELRQMEHCRCEPPVPSRVAHHLECSLERSEISLCQGFSSVKWVLRSDIRLLKGPSGLM